MRLLAWTFEHHFLVSFLTSSWDPIFSDFVANLDPTWPPTWPQVGPSWPNLAPTWPSLAPTWPSLAPSWLHFGDKLAPSWSQVGPKLVIAQVKLTLKCNFANMPKTLKNQLFFNDFCGLQPSRCAYLAPDLQILVSTWGNLSYLKPS